MAGAHSSLTIPVTLAILTVLWGCGLGFLDDSKKLTYKLNLTLEPKQVTRARSKNVKLRCEPARTQTVQIETFNMMRILKQDPTDATGNTWNSLVGKTNVKVEDAVLEFVWPVATSETFGTYHCDSIGFTADGSIVAGNTPNIEIILGGVTASDLLDVLMESKARLQDEVANNSVEIGNLKGELDILTEREMNRSDVIGQRLAASEHAMETVMHRLLFPEIPWPSGPYALLQPETGCPLDLNFYGGHTGFFTIHAESGGKSGTIVNTETHLTKPVVTTYGNDVFVTLKFCLSNTATSDIPWPKGEYCIHRATQSCPPGFSSGRISLDTEDTNNQDAQGGNYPSSTPAVLWFCCMTTGDYSTPIVLPTEKPFYLYRYKSPCQVVAGMDVKIDYFEIALETGGNAVSGANPYTIFKDNARRFEFCYYSKK